MNSLSVELISKITHSIIPSILEAMVAFLGALIVTLLMVQIFLRSIFSSPILGIEELVRYIFVWFIFLGAVLATAKQAHIKPGISISEFLPSAISKWLMCLVRVGCVIAVTLFFVNSLTLLDLNKNKLSPALQLPMYYVWLSAPVCSALMLPYLILGLFWDEESNDCQLDNLSKRKPIPVNHKDDNV